MKNRKQIQDLHDILNLQDFENDNDDNIRRGMLAVCCWILDCDGNNVKVMNEFIISNQHLIKQ